jgi:hypothetical protein
MADQWAELLVNAPDRRTAETFAVRLAELLPTLEVLMGTGPDVPVSAPAPPRYVVWALVRDVGGTPATRAATRAAVDRALAELDVTLDAGPAAEALDMTVVFLA